MKLSVYAKLWIGMFGLWTSLSYADMTVHDDLGRTLSFEKPVQRVVALAPHIVESVFAAGGGDSLVGVSEYSDYPEAAKRIPRVGNSQTLNVEYLLSLKPDLVITWHTGRAARLLPKLEKLGLSVYASNPKTLQDVPKAIRNYGMLTGHAALAEQRALAYESSLSTLKTRYVASSDRAPPVSVFYQVWADPLQTLNGQHLVSDVIALCGGRNVFAEAPAIAPKIGLEAVIARDPEVILSTWDTESGPYPLNIWKDWPAIRAVKNKALYTVPPDLLNRHGPRILEGAKQVCEHLLKARKFR